MRRPLATYALLAVGLVLVVDLLIANPWLDPVADAVRELLVLLAAAAAITGVVALAVHHGGVALAGHGDRLGSLVLLGGLGLMLVVGLRPGAEGASDPGLRWLVAALLAPLGAAFLSLVFIFLLGALRRGVAARPAETGVMLVAAAAVVVLLLPMGGTAGDLLGGAAGWVQEVPIGAVFRGLLIGVAIVGAVTAARVLLAIDGDR